MSVVTTRVEAMALSDPNFEQLPVVREIIFPLGEPPSNDDRSWRFTKEDLAEVVRNFERRPDKYMPVEYQHGKCIKHGSEAAGWIDHLELADDGLYAHVRYTDEARADIKAGKWGYRSPDWEAPQDADGAYRARRLLKLAIVNDPGIGGMPPIKAATTATAPAGAPTAAINGEQEERTMGDSQTVTAAKKQSAAFDKPGLLGLLRQEYAMPEAVSDEMLVKMFMEALSGVPEQDEAPDAEKKDEPPPVDLPIPAAASAKPRIELVEDEAAIKASREKVKTLVASAVASGKVTDATIESAVRFCTADPDGFAAWAEVAPVLAPASGQVVKASAADRAPKSVADRLTEKYRNEAASRRHFTQRSA